MKACTKTEISQMKHDQQIVLEETTCIHQMHIEESKRFYTIKEEIKKVNKAISALQKEKECISSSILQMRKHVKQNQDKIVSQTISTKDLINTVVKFESSINKDRRNSGRNAYSKSNSSVHTSKSITK